MPRAASLILGALAMGASPVSAQTILLQIKPHVGDTIKMHLTQTVEITGTRWNKSGDSTQTMTSSTEVFSRAVPFKWTPGGTLVHAITDSVISGRPLAASSQRRSAVPAPAVLRVAADGSIEFVGDGDANSEIRNLFAEMPSMLPRTAVAVGEKWSKEMRIPLAGEPGAEGTVKAALQFDSLSRSGGIAFISIRGTIARFVDRGRPVPPSRYRTAGTFTGTIQIDRALGWITDARSEISVRSEIADEGSRPTQNLAKPLRVQTKVSVWTRAVKQK